MALKIFSMMVNGLIVYLDFHIILALLTNYDEMKLSIINKIVILLMSTLPYSIFNTILLARKNSQYINKVISQNLIYSTTICIILLGYIYDLLFISTFTTIAISTITLWNTITPYLNNFENPIKHDHFLKIFLMNILLVIYNTYFDLSEIKTLGLPIWIFLLIGSTFWQLYYLDLNDNLLFGGNTLNQLAKNSRKAYHKYFPQNS